ncbi:MAG: phage portal protein [Candidatus Aminicenantes bacterium]|nr:phage portal protein [Candidatus Aminicenantes bacterium]
MNIFARLKNYLFRNLSVTDEKAWDKSLWNLVGSQSLSGENVTESTALTYSAVYNAVSLISGTIGALPLHLMQRKGQKKRIADDRILYRVMQSQWNPYMTAMAGRETMMAHVLTWGNGYAEKVWNGYGEIMELWPITPNRVRPVIEAGELVYKIKMDREADIILPRDKVLHVPGLGFDGFMGYSVIAMARKSIGLSMALETFGALFFGNGTNPGMVVSHPGKLSPVAHDNLKGSLTTAAGGLGKSHRLLLLEEGMKVEKYGIPPDDCQFLESRGFQIPEVARWFNLPPHKLKDLTRSSFSNIESEQISYLTDSILPWLVRLEANFNMQLLTASDKELSGRGRLYFKHSVEGLLRGDAASRGSFYSQMFNIGALSINEIRAFEDLDPVEGGDIHLVPLNMTSLENAGKEPTETHRPILPTLPKKKGGEEGEEEGEE